MIQDAQLFLAPTPSLLPSTPPRNSNCSRAVRQGPSAFTYVANETDCYALQAFLMNLNGGQMSMSEVVVDQVEDGTGEEALELAAEERRLFTQPLDLSVEALVSRIDRDSLILQPEFQREYVWTPNKASLLVESILMRIPLPVIYFAETPESDWEVVDGQQRLTSLYSFVRGQFPDGTPFRLGRLQVRSDLSGKSFKELPRADQNAILNYTLRAVVLQKDSHPDLKFEVFERLNCGSVQLTDAELRNCMYRGPYNDMLAELSKNEFLLRIRRATAPHKRMEDRQLILRFLAMKRNSHLNYRGSMKQFMNREMLQHRLAKPGEVAEMTEWFENAIECAWTVFGEDAFRRWSPGDAANPEGQWESKLNIALWDTVLYTFAFFDRRQIVAAADAIREEFLDIMTNDEAFVEHIGRTTDKPEKVRYRAETWRMRMDKVVDVPANEARAFTRKLKVEMHTADPTCAICHQHIQAHEDAEVDHIVHYWRGGATIPKNGRLAHRYCNRARGGRP